MILIGIVAIIVAVVGGLFVTAFGGFIHPDAGPNFLWGIYESVLICVCTGIIVKRIDKKDK